ncbi:MAG: methyl-accepting chemotaxis protein [Ruminococcus sp.]|jgi:methyl-accepting chemotaxis protein|nr:methyl-accepting chemotaxis protein [Ruminococcus sp.]
MKNLKITPKLIVSFLIVAAFSLVIGIVGIVASSVISNSASLMYDEPVIAINAVSVMRGRFNNIRVNLLRIARDSGDAAAVNDSYNNIKSYQQDIEDAIATYESTVTDWDAETAFNTFEKNYESYSSIFDKVKAAADTGDSESVYAIINEHMSESDAVVKAVEDVAAYNVQIAKDLDATADRTTLIATIIQICVIILAVAVALGIAVSTAKSIADPIKNLNKVAIQAGTTGNLSFTPEEIAVTKSYASGKDEIAESIGNFAHFMDTIIGYMEELAKVADKDLTVKLKPLSDKDTVANSINKMSAELSALIKTIQTTTTEVNTSTLQLAEASQTMAEGTTEQAASIEELSASIADVAEKTKSNSIMSRQAADISEGIKVSAEKGNDQMTEMTKAVDEINLASQDISKVIKVIDDIAFQTNILALNAAVEAARAGEAGKGFAVVADEVRNLASKSAAAAKETSSLIENSMKKAELGAKIAGETAESLSGIVKGVNDATQIFESIATSSEEQNLSIEQINIGISQVSEVIQRNSAITEETAASSEELSAQSRNLHDIIAVFRV